MQRLAGLGAIALTLTVGLTGCGGPVEATKKEVLGMLKDPDSAKFRKVEVKDHHWKSPDGKYFVEIKAVCGEVNSKNGFGGYAGFSPFVKVLASNVNGVQGEEKPVYVTSSPYPLLESSDYAQACEGTAPGLGLPRR